MMPLHAPPANRSTAKGAPPNHFSTSTCVPSVSKKSPHSPSHRGTLVSYSISFSYVVDTRQQQKTNSAGRKKVSHTSHFRVMSVSVRPVTSAKGNVPSAPSFSLWQNSSTMLRSAKNREEQEVAIQVMDHRCRVKATFSSDSSQKPIKAVDPIWWLKSS